MNDAQYSVIRTLADPARGELFNVGILIWQESDYRLIVDTDAMKRAARNSQWLHKDALLFLEPHVRELMRGIEIFDEPSMRSVLSELSHYPLVASEPRRAGIPDGYTLSTTLELLKKRMVTPYIQSGGVPSSIKRDLRRATQPLFAASIAHRDFTVMNTKSGRPRQVDVFVNSGADIAIDGINLSLAKADDIYTRADAQAFKVVDIGRAGISRFIVYCSLPERGEMRTVSMHAEAVLASAGAQVVVDPMELDAIIAELLPEDSVINAIGMS